MTPHQVRALLAGELPPALLIRGPGAWAVVAAAARPGWELHERLDADAARQVRADAYVTPPGGVRTFALNLAGASALVQNALLKVMEEPPATARFVLAATAPLETVLSRCQVVTLSGTAGRAAVADKDGAAVAAAIRAARGGQPGALAQAVRGWSTRPGEDGEIAALRTWVLEAASGRWRAFSPGFAPGVTPAQALAVAGLLTRYAGSRLAPLVALEPLRGR